MSKLKLRNVVASALRSVFLRTASLAAFSQLFIFQAQTTVVYSGIGFSLATLPLFSKNAEAQNRGQKKLRRKLRKKLALRSLSQLSADARLYDFSLSEELDTILTTSADTNLYDPLTVMRLRVLKEDAQPYWSEYDIDPYKTRSVVQKALAIQTTVSVIPRIKESELRPTFKYIERSFKDLTNFFRYSLQDKGDGFTISKQNKGEKLVELQVNFNLSKGMDPQLNLGDSVRLRYDWVDQAALFEYGFNF